MSRTDVLQLADFIVQSREYGTLRQEMRPASCAQSRDFIYCSRQDRSNNGTISKLFTRSSKLVYGKLLLMSEGAGGHRSCFLSSSEPIEWSFHFFVNYYLPLDCTISLGTSSSFGLSF